MLTQTASELVRLREVSQGSYARALDLEGQIANIEYHALLDELNLKDGAKVRTPSGTVRICGSCGTLWLQGTCKGKRINLFDLHHHHHVKEPRSAQV
jgi:hypothetical protein